MATRNRRRRAANLDQTQGEAAPDVPRTTSSGDAGLPESAAEVRKVSSLGDRSIAVGGDVRDSVVVSGDYYAAGAESRRVALTKATLWPWLQQEWGKVLGAAAIVGLIASVLQIATSLSPSAPTRPPPMTGQINIAVADFGGADANVGHELADSFYRSLMSQKHDLEAEPDGVAYDIPVRAPLAAERIVGKSREERAKAAESLARDVNADIVIYGDVTSAPAALTFSPEFYLSERRLPDAQELVGQYEFGSPITVPGPPDNPETKRQLQARLLSRTGALGHFAIGLSKYAADQFPGAVERFQAAEKAAGWDARDGKEVLYLFMGNAQGKSGDLNGAAASYAQALSLNAEYARARLGAAEVEFQRGKGLCEAGSADGPLLEASIRDFTAALSARAQPAQSDIRPKAALRVGRAQVCLSQALIADGWSKADVQFQSVVDEYQAGNSRIRDLAAEAYAGLALVHTPALGDADATAGYQRAANEYSQAISLSLHPDRQGVFQANLGFIYGRLGDVQKADEAYRQASVLDAANGAAYEAARLTLR